MNRSQIQKKNNEKPQEKLKQEDLGKLHEREIQLLFWLRKRWRFGEVTILMRDGIPYRVTRAFESKDLE